MFLLIILTICSVKLVLTFIVLDLDSKNENVEWILEDEQKSMNVPGTVPGGVYSDLQKAGEIDNILKKYSDLKTRWVARRCWVYMVKFNVSSELLEEPARLVLHGVDTVAQIELNGHQIGSTNNMFLRYVFDVTAYLRSGNNELKINFTSPIEAAKSRAIKFGIEPNCMPGIYARKGECHINQLRKMQVSFGSDWGPAFPSVGLWKSALIEFGNAAVIRSVTTHLNNKNKQWHLKIKAHIDTVFRNKYLKGNIEAKLEVQAHESIDNAKYVNITTEDDGSAVVEVDMKINESMVSLWWPNGFGSQNLYDLTVWLSLGKHLSERVSKSKRVQIGFRTLELVEQEASLVLGNNSAGKGPTFYFKVNGYPLFMKGSNWVPAHILPEYGANQSIVDNLLLAARDAHMTMLRVWGGGVYESDYFYERCDQLGILVWQDFMFTGSMYPVDPEFLQSVREEIKQNIIRLQHHASIALWVGNNENEDALTHNRFNTGGDFAKNKKKNITLYIDTIKPIVNALDPGRRYLVSSLSNGLKSEQKSYKTLNPYDALYGDSYYFNNKGDCWNFTAYEKSRFASKFGFQSFPSLATLRMATTEPKDLRLDSTYIWHIQHSVGGSETILHQVLKHIKLNKSSQNYFEKFVFYSQILQAMAIKMETEFYRQSQEDWYTMGALYWQLNDVWPAPTWSSIECGGNWKILHHFAKSFFAPVLVSPRMTSNKAIEVFVINDRFVPIKDAFIQIDLFEWDSLVPKNTYIYLASCGPLSTKKQNIQLTDKTFKSKETSFLRFSLKDKNVKSSPYNFIFPLPLKDVVGLKKPYIESDCYSTVALTVDHADQCELLSTLKIKVLDHTEKLSKGNQFTVNVRVDTVVLFLWLETSNLQGRFEDNGFIVTTPQLTVHYVCQNDIAPKELEQTITYQYYINE